MLNRKNINIHGICSLDYYYNSMNLIEHHQGPQQYFIFSDDIDWCKSNLAINNATYVNSSEDRIPHEDIYLMSLCSNNIIANSTFSWWGAWLNNNKHKFITAPKKWFADQKLQSQSHDIVPKSWKRV